MDTTDNPQQNSNSSKDSSRSSLSATGDSHPPPTPLVKNKNYAGPPIPLKEKRHSSSIFNVSQDRHLVPLPNIKDSSRSSLSATGDSHPPPTPLVKNKNYAGPPIPLKEKRHSSSIFNVSQDRHLVPLPNIKDAATPQEREQLFLQKLQQCCVVFDFQPDPLSDLQGKEVKRNILNELIECVLDSRPSASNGGSANGGTGPNGGSIITEAIYPAVVKM
nr:hypothetical transcript [Hymenolepis microstoma]